MQHVILLKQWQRVCTDGEVPFGRRDTPATVNCLRRELARVNVNAANMEGLNVTGRDCVFLSMTHCVKSASDGTRRMKDDGSRVECGQAIADDVSELIGGDMRDIVPLPTPYLVKGTTSTATNSAPYTCPIMPSALAPQIQEHGTPVSTLLG